MKLESVERIAVAPSNLTNEELAQHIRFYYPNLHGPLRMMYERFAHNATALDNDYQTEPQEELCGQCPHCGSLLELNITI